MKPNPDEHAFYAAQARHVRQCVKEAWIVVACWVVGIVYCTTVFVTMGYMPAEQRPAEPLLVWGVPAWVFWGLFFPWFVQIAAAWWFAIRVLKDDEPHMEFPEEAGTRKDQMTHD